MLFGEIDKLLLKFIWKCKGPRVAETILEKNKVGSLPVSEKNIKVTVIKIM